jgi:cysteinyl-tRNA synthetase
VIGAGIVEYYNIPLEDCNSILIHQLTKDLADDLDTPKMLAVWHKMIQNVNENFWSRWWFVFEHIDVHHDSEWLMNAPELEIEVIKAMLYLDATILKIGLYAWVVAYLSAQHAPEDIVALATARWEAKMAKNWGKADEMREELAARGWEMKDGKDGWELVRG